MRQIGAALGIALLIVVLGDPSAADATDRYQRAWAFMALTGVVSALIGLALGRVRARHVNEPAAGPVPLAARDGGTDAAQR